MIDEPHANISNVAAEARIRRMIRDKALSRSAKIERITTLARHLSESSPALLGLVEREFIGIYGCEYLQNADGFTESLGLYRELASIFPSDWRPACHIANLLMLNNEPQAAVRLYNQAFLVDPLLHYDVLGELPDYIAAADDLERIKFSVTLMQCYLLDGVIEKGDIDMANLIEMYRELALEFGDNHPALQELLATNRIRHDLLPILEKYAKKT